VKTLIHRGALTDLLIATIETATGFRCGDAEAPKRVEGLKDAGWTGNPGEEGSTFTPYNVLTPQTATLSSGSFSDPQDGWQLPYGLSTFGISRKMTEALAHEARKSLRSLTRTDVTLDGALFRVQQIWYPAIGGVGRVDGTQVASTFGEVDTITVWLSQ
jgi:hypothetical protein